jgi:hypothetical protein
VQLARAVGEVLAREREAHEVRSRAAGAGRAAREVRQGARGEQAAERVLARLERALLLAAARREPADLGAQRARLALLRLQPAVGGRDRGLRGAQRVARLAALGLAAFELAAQRLDPRAQRGEILFLARALRRADGQENRGEQGAFQALLFPCAATAATRFAISSGSPR